MDGPVRRLGAATVLLIAIACTRPKLPVLGELPAFQLKDQRGRHFTLGSLAGRPFVADFIFTRCGGVCPGMTARMARLQKQLPAEVSLVSFTVDPAHDTPEVLERYARDFGAGPEWTFASGTKEALYDLATRGFKLAAMEVPPEQQQEGGDGPFLHSSKFVLVDGRGRVRAYYDSEDEQALLRLADDATSLAKAP